MSRAGEVALVRQSGQDRVAVRTHDEWIDELGDSWDDDAVARYGRSLVVINPEDHAQVDALTKVLMEACYSHGNVVVSDHGIHPSTMQAALRSLIADPKPEEPTGLGAVVEDESGERFVRLCPKTDCANGCHAWTNVETGHAVLYSRIAAVKVLSEGVTA